MTDKGVTVEGLHGFHAICQALFNVAGLVQYLGARSLGQADCLLRGGREAVFRSIRFIPFDLELFASLHCCPCRRGNNCNARHDWHSAWAKVLHMVSFEDEGIGYAG